MLCTVQVLRTSPITQAKAAKALQSFLGSPDSSLIDADRCAMPPSLAQLAVCVLALCGWRWRSTAPPKAPLRLRAAWRDLNQLRERDYQARDEQ